MTISDASAPAHDDDPFPLRIHPDTQSNPLTLAVGRFLLDRAERSPLRPSSVSEYRTAAAKWQQFCESRSGDPNGYRSARPMPVSSYPPSTQELTDFQLFVVAAHTGQNAQRAANKYCGKLMAVLRWDCKLSGSTVLPPPDALRAEEVAAKLWMSMADVGRLYDCCDCASWPRLSRSRRAFHHSPATYWRAAIVLLFNYGCDWQQLASWCGESPHRLRWRNVRWSSAYPGDDADVSSDFGWLWYVRQKTAAKRPQEIVLPMNAAIRDHLISIAPSGADAPALEASDQPIFDWPRNAKATHATWQSICAAAKVAPKPSLRTGDEREFLLKHFRKTCSTYHNTHLAGAASLVLGHARSTGEVLTLRHYAHPAMALLNAMRLPQPSSFESLSIDPQRLRRFLRPADDLQGRLFD